MDDLTVADVVTQIFTTTNPETGSTPPEHIAWVIFGEETVFLTGPTDELPVESPPKALAKAAMEALLELGAPAAGTPSADFRVSRLPWFPDDFVYMVSYNHPNLFNIVVGDAETSDLSAGMTGRATREADVDAPAIITVRDFGGTTWSDSPGTQAPSA